MNKNGMMVALCYGELKPKVVRPAALQILSASESKRTEETIMLWTILVVLMILWLLGLVGGVGGGLIHLLLVLAVIVLIFQLLSGRRSVV